MTTHTSDVADLPEALTEYLEAQDALDNREYAGINAEPYEKLVRSRNHARAALESALAAGQATASPTPPAEQPIGEVVVTKDEGGQIVAVTRQDDEGRILSVIATSDPAEQQATKETSGEQGPADGESK